MTKQAKRLAKWFELWEATKKMLRIDSQFTVESQEIFDALMELAND